MQKDIDTKQEASGGLLKDELWTKAQVAKFLHRTERSVESFVAKGIIPAIRLTPRTVLFHKKSVEKALLELQTGAKP